MRNVYVNGQLLLEVGQRTPPEPDLIDWTQTVWAWFDLNTNTDMVTNTPPTYSAIRYVLEGKARKLRVVPA